jgi:hypothetical protein
LTPLACRTAFPVKLSAPEGSLEKVEQMRGERGGDTYTIFEKFEKGEPKFAGFGRLGGSAREGRPAPKPAPAAPPLGLGVMMDGSMSLRLKEGFSLRGGGPGRGREEMSGFGSG